MRILLFIILLGLTFSTPLPLVAIAAVLYAFRYPAYELIVLGALADALYGGALFSYVYTLSATIIFIIVELVKPFLSFYDSPA